jgi:hypothetical protein
MLAWAEVLPLALRESSATLSPLDEVLGSGASGYGDRVTRRECAGCVAAAALDHIRGENPGGIPLERRGGLR